MASVRLRKTGSVFRHSDGTFDVRSLPDMGGPFETAAAFFEAWVSRAKFPFSEKYVHERMRGGPVEEVLSSITHFPTRTTALAGSLSSHNDGPFPTYHPDHYHSNIVFDKSFNILSIIDWQGACTVPWELVQFPLFLSMIPRAMDADFNDDEYGRPKDPDTQLRWQERADYVQLVREAEVSKMKEATLSSILGNTNVQGLACAIKLYHDPGRLRFYDRILQPFQHKHIGNV